MPDRYIDQPKRVHGLTTVEIDVAVGVRYTITEGTPEYIPPYSKPENYDPGSDTICEIEHVLYTFGEGGPVLDIQNLLTSEQLEYIENFILKEEGYDV